MSIIKYLTVIFLTTFFLTQKALSEEVKKVGKPVLQSPKNNPREARLFVSFRPNEKILDEISITPGYEFNKKNSIIAKSGKNKYKFDISQDSFAWIADNKQEKKMIRTMKKGSRIMITGYNQKGSQTIDHYSLLGFSKAYGAAKKSCS